jgi:hypothetical protein
MHNDPGVQPDSPENDTPAAEEKRAWTAPSVTELPRLTDLTLQTGIGGGGDTGGSGSTVF